MSAPTRRRRFRDLDPTPSSEAGWDGAQRATRIPSWIPRRFHWPLRISWRLTLGLAFCALAVALFYLCLAFRYDLRAVARMPERSVVQDATGLELGSLHGQNRRLIPRSEIPPFFVKALEAREDARFLEHHGIDLRGVARATLRNTRDRSFTQGASTLTMQLARNTYDLWDPSLHRKMVEMALSLRIEAHYSKDQILTHYLNRIYFGSGCYGLEEAALTYFGVPTSELNRNQCALLVGIIRAPHACSPLRNLRGAAIQRDEVLERMIASGMISQSAFQEIRSLPLHLNESASTSPEAVRAARRHFSELVLDSEREQGGLTIRTTIHSKLQSDLEHALNSSPIPDGVQLGALCLESGSGAIRAVVGGREDTRSAFNRALDIRRDLGPVFTPFLYAMAAERHHTLHPDEPVRTGRQLGREETLRLAKRLGLTGMAAQAEDDLYRGSLATSPLQVATAAATLRNHGARPRTFFIEQILTPDQRPFFRHHPSSTPALQAESASAALAACGGAPARPLVLSGFSPGKRDFWVLAIGTHHTVCLWLGHDIPEALALPESLQTSLVDVLETLAHKL